MTDEQTNAFRASLRGLSRADLEEESTYLFVRLEATLVHLDKLEKELWGTKKVAAAYKEGRDHHAKQAVVARGQAAEARAAAREQAAEAKGASESAAEWEATALILRTERDALARRVAVYREQCDRARQAAQRARAALGEREERATFEESLDYWRDTWQEHR